MVKFFSFIGVFLVSSAFGQTFRNVRVLKEEDKLVIIYDLINVETGSRVYVRVFSSHNNFESPLVNVIGDVGEVLPGPNRRIEWPAKDLPQNYKGEFTFQFKGEIIEGLKFLNPDNGILRRGKKYTLKWRGGQPSDTVTMKLISPRLQTTDIVSGKNTGVYKWKAKKNIETGSGYVLRLSRGKEVIEQQITVKRKIPIVFIAIPVVGVAIYFIASDAGSSGSEDLPNAPKPN